LLMFAELFTHNAVVIIVLVSLGICLLRLATALINPPLQVVVTNHFQEHGSHGLGLLTCFQYLFAAAGTMVVSGLPFEPSVNLMSSTLIFVLLSGLGYWFSRNK
jgi:hypothetical protein